MYTRGICVERYMLLSLALFLRAHVATRICVHVHFWGLLRYGCLQMFVGHGVEVIPRLGTAGPFGSICKNLVERAPKAPWQDAALVSRDMISRHSSGRVHP